MAQSTAEHKVLLTAEQRADLVRMTRQSSIGVAIKRWATILLRADPDHADGGATDEEIAEQVGVSVRHLERIRKKFALGGFDAALVRKPRSDAGIPEVFDGPTEAQLVTLACSTPPEGRALRTRSTRCRSSPANRKASTTNTNATAPARYLCFTVRSAAGGGSVAATAGPRSIGPRKSGVCWRSITPRRNW